MASPKSATIRKFVTLAITTAVTVPLVSAGAALAQGRALYGAIAWDRYTQSYGYSYNYTSLAEAQTRAVDECNSYSGGYDCTVLVSFEGCGALAQSTEGAAGTGWGTTSELAQYYAVESCSEYGTYCEVIQTVCNDGYY